MQKSQYKSQYIDEEIWNQCAKHMKKEQTRRCYYKEMVEIAEMFQEDFFKLSREQVAKYFNVYLNERRARGEIKTSTIKKKASILHAIYEWQQDFLIKKEMQNVCLEEVQYKKMTNDMQKNPYSEFCTYDKIKRINPLRIPSNRELEDISGQIKGNDTLECIFLLFEYGGVQLVEIEEIENRDVSFSEDHAHITIGNRHNYGTRARAIHIPIEKAGAFIRLKAGEDDTGSFLKNKYKKPLRRRIMQTYYRQCLPDSPYSLAEIRTAYIVKALAEDEISAVQNMALGERWRTRYKILAENYKCQPSHT